MYIAGTWVAVHAAYYEYDKHTLGLRISNIITKTTKATSTLYYREDIKTILRLNTE